jgi:hypothetical protein
MEYFPKIDKEDKEIIDKFSYEDWYKEIPENFKIDINDLKIENDSEFNYDIWFEKLNSENKIKAEYSKIIKNIKITENITHYVEDNFFEKEFYGDLEILEEKLNKVIFGEENNENKEKNKKEFSKNQIDYFKNIIDIIIQRIIENFDFYNECKSKNSYEKQKNFIKENFWKNREDYDKENYDFDFDFKISPITTAIYLSEEDYIKETGLDSVSVTIKLFNKSWIVLQNIEGKEKTLNHEIRHVLFSLYSEFLNMKLINNISSEFLEKNNIGYENHKNLLKELENYIYKIFQNEFISYISNQDFKTMSYYNLIGYKIDELDLIFNELKKKYNEEEIEEIKKIYKNKIKFALNNCEKYKFFAEQLFLKYKSENKPMHEFESIIRNIEPQKYKRLCIFLGINPEKSKEIYN